MVNTAQVIIHASRLGNIEVLEEMIRRQTDVDVQDEKGHTPLITACNNNKYEAASLLLKCGANVNARDHAGNTALKFAVLSGRFNIIRLLLKHGADKRLLNIPS